MRGTRVRKLTAIFNEVVKRGLVPAKDLRWPNRHWRKFKKMYLTGELWDIFPSM